MHIAVGSGQCWTVQLLPFAAVIHMGRGLLSIRLPREGIATIFDRDLLDPRMLFADFGAHAQVTSASVIWRAASPTAYALPYVPR